MSPPSSGQDSSCFIYDYVVNIVYQPVVQRGTNNPTVNVSDMDVTGRAAVKDTVPCVLAPQPGCMTRLPPQVSEKLVSAFSLNKGKSL